MFGVPLLARGSKSLSLAIFIAVNTCCWRPDVFYSMRRRRCDMLERTCFKGIVSQFGNIYNRHDGCGSRPTVN